METTVNENLEIELKNLDDRIKEEHNKFQDWFLSALAEERKALNLVYKSMHRINSKPF